MIQTEKDIEIVLNYRLSQYLSEYPIDVAYPNKTYTPEIDTSYLKVDYLHGETSQVELGTESDDRAVGVFQITMNVKNDEGHSAVTTLVSQLKEYFKRGTVATYGGLNVRITAFYLGSYESETDWYREVINIVFRSDISNI
jgi:hypothetical protein